MDAQGEELVMHTAHYKYSFYKLLYIYIYIYIYIIYMATVVLFCYIFFFTFSHCVQLWICNEIEFFTVNVK